MKNILFSLSVLCCFTFQEGRSQTVVELAIKPSEFILQNFETHLGVGTQKLRFGIYLSYRPSTQESGETKPLGHGGLGGYGQNAFNKFYTSYTLGIYQKTYFKKHFFLEADLFYRNWNFQNKQIEFNNIEGYEFRGERTENVKVGGLKLLVGRTFFFSRKERKIRPYFDLYFGIGVRYKENTYQTFNGYIEEVYYDYIKEQESYWRPTPQGGVKLGLLLTK